MFKFYKNFICIIFATMKFTPDKYLLICLLVCTEIFAGPNPPNPPPPAPPPPPGFAIDSGLIFLLFFGVLFSFFFLKNLNVSKNKI